MKLIFEVDPKDVGEVKTTISILSKFLPASDGPVTVASDESDEDRKKRIAKEKRTAKAAAAKAEAETGDDDDDTDTETTEATEVFPDLEDVRKKLKEHAALEGKASAVAILKDHGSASITELAQEEYQGVMDDCG